MFVKDFELAQAQIISKDLASALQHSESAVQEAKVKVLKLEQYNAELQKGTYFRVATKLSKF